VTWMELIDEFLNRLKTDLRLREDLIVERRNRYFLVRRTLRGFVQRDFYHAGAYLGKIKNGVFFPSFILLSMIAEQKANKVVVDGKTAWLFVCGRDIFKRGILNVSGSGRKGNYALVLNEHGECLGFGRVLSDIGKVEDPKKVVIKNVSDIGDFLRRER
jgi:ribosome biogenesis protein Nip4